MWSALGARCITIRVDWGPSCWRIVHVVRVPRTGQLLHLGLVQPERAHGLSSVCMLSQRFNHRTCDIRSREFSHTARDSPPESDLLV